MTRRQGLPLRRLVRRLPTEPAAVAQPRQASDNPSHKRKFMMPWNVLNEACFDLSIRYYRHRLGSTSERWHQTLKNRILLENYFLPGDLETQIEAFVEHYIHCRYHESLSNLTPADVYFGRGQTILLEREWIKRKTIQHRRLQHRKPAA